MSSHINHYSSAEESNVSDQKKPDREVVFSMEVDQYFEFVDQATMVASVGTRPVVRPPAGAAMLTLEADEMTEFVVKAIPAGGQKRESA